MVLTAISHSAACVLVAAGDGDDAPADAADELIALVFGSKKMVQSFERTTRIIEKIDKTAGK